MNSKNYSNSANSEDATAWTAKENSIVEEEEQENGKRKRVKIKENVEKSSESLLTLDPDSAAISLVAKEENDSSENEVTQKTETNMSVRSADTATFKEAMSTEKAKDVCLQSAIPFLVAGLGSIGAGQVLNRATQTYLFRTVPEMTALTTPLMGLKGNLDLTFASRLTTMVHKGGLKTLNDLKKNVPIYMFMVQGQAIVMSAVTCLLTIIFMQIKLASGLVPEEEKAKMNGNVNSRWPFIPLLSASAVSTISSSAALMSVVTITLVMSARRYHINPDNVIAPIASSIGDLMCMGLLMGFSHLFFLSHPQWWPSLCISIVFLCLLPLWMVLTCKDPHARESLKTGWMSLIASAVLQSLAGCLLDYASQKYPDCTLYQPILSGIAGNRVAVQASRISSVLHSNAGQIGQFPDDAKLKELISPKRILVGNELDVRSGRMLLFTAIPFQILFLLTSYLVAYIAHVGDKEAMPKINIVFTFAYLVTAFVQIASMLYSAQLICYGMWKMKIDPDFHSIPILTGLGDLSGVGLLTLLYMILQHVSPQHIKIARIVNGTTILNV